MTGLCFDLRAPLDFGRTRAYIHRYEIPQPVGADENALYAAHCDRAGSFLVELRSPAPRRVVARQLTGRASRLRAELVTRFVHRTLGSDESLLAFYRFARRDPHLAALVRRFRGVRVVGVVGLWECLLWSILGQQVSVASAFAMRSRLARQTGAVVRWNGLEFEAFPAPDDVLHLRACDWRACGVSRKKAEFITRIAQLVSTGQLQDDTFSALSREQARAQLLALPGIGPWSCEYAMLRVHGDPDACPLEDIGLRNALGSVFALGRQATVEECRQFTAPWRPFRGFATFYLWQLLF